MTAKEKRLIQAATKALALMEECTEAQRDCYYGASFIIKRKDWTTTTDRLRKALELNQESNPDFLRR